MERSFLHRNRTADLEEIMFSHRQPWHHRSPGHDCRNFHYEDSNCCPRLFSTNVCLIAHPISGRSIQRFKSSSQSRQGVFNTNVLRNWWNCNGGVCSHAEISHRGVFHQSCVTARGCIRGTCLEQVRSPFWVGLIGNTLAYNSGPRQEKPPSISFILVHCVGSRLYV